jgi:suppressor of G2 allele of SKP1
LKRKEFSAALADAERVTERDARNDVAHLRRGIALFELGRFDDALKSFTTGADVSQGVGGQFQTWLSKTRVAIAQSTNSSTSTSSTAVDIDAAKRDDAAIANAAAAAAEAAKPRYRHDWYQNATHVTVELFVKKLAKDNTVIEFREDNVRLVVRPPDAQPDEPPFELSLHLFDAIDPSKSQVSYLSTKLVLKLAKATASQWATLERAAGDAAQRKALSVVTNPGSSSAAGDTSGKKHLASFEKNWDALAKEIVPEEKPEGDEALNALFKSIYKDGSDEQRKAMIKSFTESGGTCLSTNWSDVGARKVDITPPDGMVAKKYDDLS